MEWKDKGIVLSVRKHGNTSAIVTLMTENHGKHAGYVRGALGKRSAALYQQGNLLEVSWFSRTEDGLGSYSCESLKPYSATIMRDNLKLSYLLASCEMVEVTLQEREKSTLVYNAMIDFFETIIYEDEKTDFHSAEIEQSLEVNTISKAQHYILFELILLQESGFGLDISQCALTGQDENLYYVSPKTGRAVTKEAGEKWKDKLLELPVFLTSHDNLDFDKTASTRKKNIEEIKKGFILTEFFFHNHIFNDKRKEFPLSRTRLRDLVLCA